MSRALIVTTDGNPLKFNFWCRNYDKYIVGEVDKVYVTMGSHLSYDLRKVFIDLCAERNFKLILREGEGMASLSIQISLALEHINEDYLCLLEDDIWILKRGVLDSRFKLLENNRYKMIATSRSDHRLFKDVNTICERKNEIGIHGGNVAIDYWLWSNWLFVNTETLKNCQNNFIKEISKYNYVKDTVLHPIENIPHLKSYKNFIPTYMFFCGTYSKGTKIPSIHPDWVFTSDVSDEAFAIASIILIKELGVDNCLFENQIQMMNRIDELFSINKEAKEWNLDWLHATGSSGINGMYGIIRDEYNIPIAHVLSYYAFIKPELIKPQQSEISLELKQSYLSGVRYAMNLAFVKAYNRNDITEFRNDYEKYLRYHSEIESDINNIDYMSNVMISNII